MSALIRHTVLSWVWVGISLAVLGGGCTSTNGGGRGDFCAQPNACAAGFLCQAGACIPLCSADDDCRTTEICNDQSICVACTNCRQVPELTSVNGTGTADTVPGHASQHIANSLLLTGTHFSGSRVKLHGGAYDGLALALVDGNSNDSQMEVTLPQDLVAGSYTLRVSNQAGADSTSVTVLQGEQGIPGVYVAGAGIDVNGDTLSVTYGGTGGAFGTSNNVARADHGHSDIEQEIAALNTNLSSAITTGDSTTLANALSAVRGNDGIGVTTRSCTIGTNSRSGTQTFNGTSWSACTANATWSCAGEPNSEGCKTNSSFYASCAEIYTAGYRSDGVFWIQPAGTGAPFQVYCDMTTTYAGQTGGWMLVFNLDTSDGNTRHFQSSFWRNTTVYGNPLQPFSSDYKSLVFSTVNVANKQIMLLGHNNGNVYDRAFYNVIANSTGGNTSSNSGTFASLFAITGEWGAGTEVDRVLTGNHKNADGTDYTGPTNSIVVGLKKAHWVDSSPADGVCDTGYCVDVTPVGNAGRRQNGGDSFFETALPIVINSASLSRFSGAANNVRLGVNWSTLNNVNNGVNDSVYNAGGWGGYHSSNNLWVGFYEGSALCSYNTTNGGCGYGMNAMPLLGYETTNPFGDASNNNHDAPEFDLALFIR